MKKLSLRRRRDDREAGKSTKSFEEYSALKRKTRGLQQADTRAASENPDETGDTHIGIIRGAATADSCCADSLCMQMMFLRDSKTAQQWLADDQDNREVFTLQEAAEFGSRFFVPLMS